MEETLMGKMKTKLITLGFKRDNNTIKLEGFCFLFASLMRK